jgi:hypothetical protein
MHRILLSEQETGERRNQRPAQNHAIGVFQDCGDLSPKNRIMISMKFPDNVIQWMISA